MVVDRPVAAVAAAVAAAGRLFKELNNKTEKTIFLSLIILTFYSTLYNIEL